MKTQKKSGNVIKRQGLVSLLLTITAILLPSFGGIRGGLGLLAQDIHFSQFSSSPSTLNPASTGIFTGNFRFVYNFKDQWKSVAFPYRTHAFSYDMAFLRDLITDGSLAGGLSVVSDKAGDLNFGSTQVQLSIAANKSIDKLNNFSLGLQGGFAQWALKGDAETQQWDNEYNPGTSGGYLNNPTTGSDLESFNYGDFSAGLLWNYKGPVRAHAGIALFHLNKPKQSFLGANEKMNAKLAFHGGAVIKVKEDVIAVLPQVLFLKQGPQIEGNLGALVKYRLREGSIYTGEIDETAVYLGGWYRFSDAFILNARFDYMNFALGLSYDVNISNINVATASKGGFEVSLMYIQPFPASRKTASPLM